MYHCQAIAECELPGVRAIAGSLFLSFKRFKTYELFIVSVELLMSFQVFKYLLLFFPVQVLSAGQP